jgi:asparaginyl-tRNA synthetase
MNGNIKAIKLFHEIINCLRNQFDERGYTEVVVPRLVKASGACENINTLFEIHVDGDSRWFKGHRGYLAQTGQLFLEAFVPELKKVYCLGSSFRAEPGADSRHLTEFTMAEIEFAGDFEDLLEEISETIWQLARFFIERPEAAKRAGLNADDIKRLKKIPRRFKEMTYDDAIHALVRKGEEINWGDDISSAREKMLVEMNNNEPLLITRFPDPMWEFKKDIEVEKFFNMIPDRGNPGRVLSCDLILPFGGEAVGAAARIHDHETLVRRLKNSKMFQRLVKRGGSISDFNWYIETVKNNGSVPHAGCGFGLARIAQFIAGERDIRKCVPFVLNQHNII